MASSTAAKGDVVILSETSTWERWYEDTRATVPGQLWKYFDPDSEAAITEPVPPFKPVDKPPSLGVDMPQVLMTREAKDQRQCWATINRTVP
ncbi:hypothetical protein MMC29_007685, partial [Sticta canariensis]|nr:hypothetical protein [Sticta canariensis]